MHFSTHFERVSKRISQITFAVFVLLGVAMIVALGVIRLQFTRMQNRLAPMIRQRLAQVLGRDVRIGAVHMNWLDQLVIANTAVARGATFADGTAFTVPQMTARLNLLAMAVHHGANPVAFIDQLTVTHPSLSVNRSRQGRWDFQDIVDHIKANAHTLAWHADLVVNDGSVLYHDAHGFVSGSAPIQQEVADIDASVMPTGVRTIAFEVAATDAGQHLGRIRLKGVCAKAAGGTRVDVQANREAVNAVMQYLPKNLPITITDGAAIRLSALFRNLPKPDAAHRLTGADLTADVDLTGIGLRLREMSAPLLATSGRLHLVHDASRYPNGSRVELIAVHAHAASLPVTINGSITDVNLFDLAHAHPSFNVTAGTDVKDGSIISRLFPNTRWLNKLQFGGKVALQATVQGRPGQLHVDGRLHSDEVSLPNFHATDVIGAFNLLPGADGTQQAPTARVVCTPIMPCSPTIT